MVKLDLDFFENVIIYKSLTDAGYLASILDFVNPEYFKSTNIADVFNIIKEFYVKRQKIPNITEIKSYLVTEELKTAFKNIVYSFSEIDKNLNKDELYYNTERFLKEKAVYHTMLNIATDIAKGNVDTTVALDKFEKACNISLITDKGIDLYNNIEAIIEDLSTVNGTIPSTWEWLDETLGGGFLEQGKALYVFAGETNIGKSIFLGNIATNIANQNKNVLLITLEMSELLYAKRLCSNISKIPLKDLANNPHALRTAIKENKEKTNGTILIKEFPPATITANQISAFVKKITDTGCRIDAIVLDYLNLLHTTVGNNSYERIKHITEQIRALSYVFNCPIISATQLGRCLDINTTVLAENGEKLLGDVTVGDRIEGKNDFVTVRHVYPREIKSCYKIITKTGKEIICSAQHLFPTSRDTISINTGLKVGDKLLVKKQP